MLFAILLSIISSLINITAGLILSNEVTKSYVVRKIELVSRDFHVKRIPR